VKETGTSFRYLVIALLLVGVVWAPPALAQPIIPMTWDVVADDFESGTLDAWDAGGAQSADLLPGGGYGGSTGLSIPVGQSVNDLRQTGVARAEVGYLTFWFNPNNVAIPEPTPNYWPAGSSLCIAQIRSSTSDWWPPLVGLYVRKPPGQGYKGFIAWPEAGGYNYNDHQGGQFDLVDGWQKVTIGYGINSWVGAWVDDVSVRYVSAGVVHDDPYGDVIEVGKVNENGSTAPEGAVLLDDVAFQVPRVDDLWVDAENGSDEDDGLTPSTAFATIQRAAGLAGPGTTVHILPGVYRETVHPALSGSATEPTVYRAENGPGTAVIRGSEPSSIISWTQMTGNSIGLPTGVYSNVYYADLSGWDLDGPPRFVVNLTPPPQAWGTEGGQRLPLAREPDWQVTTEWKHHEFWWVADGGSTVAGCTPTPADPNCDLDSRSMTQLTDQTDDAAPAGIEPGNLTTLGDLTGGTLVAIDTYQGHYVYRRTITAHDVGAGCITVDRVCEHDGGSGNPGLGWGSKYYVENKPRLLDTPGEWWYDVGTGRLYLWPPVPGDPATLNIEISRRDNGFSLRNRSYITLDGLTIEFLDGSAIYLANWEMHKTYGDIVRNVTLRYANWGVYVEQSVRATSPPANVIDGFTLEDSEIGYMDTYAVRLIDWWEDGAAADSFTRSGVLNTVIRNNEMHHLGFRTDGDNAVGASFSFANKLRFEGNHVHHVAHNGIQFSRSVIQSAKTYGFSPSEIKTGEILIKDNVFEKACQLTTDCGGLKIWGSPPDGHVFRDVLVTGNVFRDSFGWTYISEKRGRWPSGTGSPVRGMGGFGLYVDHASGIHAYRNVAYNNAYTGYMFSGVWRDGSMVYVNNLAANSFYGFILGSGYDTHGSIDTRVINNIAINNEAAGLTVGYAEGRTQNMTIDHNLYHLNGWGGFWPAGPMIVRESGSWEPQQTLADVQANTPWEDHGVAGDPAFWDYDPADHDLHDSSWPDFHLTSGSMNAIDRGTVQLPASLAVLLDTFDVEDYTWGSAFDIGRYEAGFAVVPVPTSRAIEAGGTAHYALSLHPSDLPHAVSLTLSSPPPGLSYTLSSDVVAPGEVVILTVAHDGSPAGQGAWHTIPITGTGGGFVQTADVAVLVGGARVYLPLVKR
jgi:hypothetical protein